MFLNPGNTNILDWIISCWGRGGCTVYSKMFSNIPVLQPRDASSTSHLSCNNEKSLQTLPNVPLGAKCNPPTPPQLRTTSVMHQSEKNNTLDLWGLQEKMLVEYIWICVQTSIYIYINDSTNTIFFFGTVSKFLLIHRSQNWITKFSTSIFN